MKSTSLIGYIQGKILLALSVALLNIPISPANAETSKVSVPLEQNLQRLELLVYQSIDQAAALFETLVPAKKTKIQQERFLIVGVKILAYQGKFELAQERISYLLKHGPSNNSKSIAYYLKARIYQSQQRYDMAFKYVNIAVQIPQNLVSVANRTQVLLLAAELKVEELDFPQALFFAKKAAKIANTLGNNMQKCTAFESMAFIYARMEHDEAATATAADISDSAIEFCEVVNSEVLLVDLYAARAVVYQKQQDYQRQLLFAQKSINLQNKTNNIVNKLQVEIILLDAYVGLNQWQKADQLLQNIWLDESTIKREGDYSELARLASVIAVAQEDISKGLLEYKKYVLWEKKVVAHVNSDKYKYFSSEFNSEISRNSDKLKRLILDNRSLTIENDELSFVSLLLLSATVIISISVAAYAYRNNNKVTTIFDVKVDSLTNLYLYRECFEYAMSQKRLVYNPKHQYAALIVDIDNFNGFVENYGYDQSDLLLQYLATRLKQSFQEYGIVLRQRDGRFIVLLASRNHEQVNRIAHESLNLLLGYTCSKQVIDFRLNIGWYYSEKLDVSKPSELDFGLACANQALEQIINLARGGAMEYRPPHIDSIGNQQPLVDDHTLQISST